MARYKTDALVLSSLNYSETSRIIHVLCRDEGRISLIAKGVRKAKGPGNAVLQPFNAVSLTYFLKEESNFGTLGTAELLHTWPALHADLYAYALASYWFEILNFASQPRLDSSQLFDLTTHYLAALNSPASSPAYRLSFFLRLFRALGFELSLPVCAACASNGVSHFDDHTGRFYCTACSAGQRFVATTPAVVSAVKAVFAAAAEVGGAPTDPESLSNSPAEAVPLFHRFISRHLDHPLRSYVFLEKITQQAQSRIRP